jgi:hypothetical protein
MISSDWRVFNKTLNFIGKILTFSILAFVCLSYSQGMCWEAHPTSSGRDMPPATAPKNESGVNIGAWLVSIFRSHISAVDSDRCPSIPSCSSYSVTAFRKHGFFIGWLMTVDRLIHEADEGSVSPLVYHNGRVKIYDPVENNDFWWFRNDEENKD